MDESPLRYNVKEGFSPATLDLIQSESAALMEASGLPIETRYAAAVIIEELSTNIMEHSGADWLELGIVATDASLEIGLRDNGRNFDPTQVLKDVNFEPDLKRFTDRHLGIYMVRRLTQSLHYTREASGHNCLSMELIQDMS